MPTTSTPILTEYSSDNHNYKADDQVQSSNKNADQESNSSHTMNIGGSRLLPQQTSSGDNATTDDPVEVDDQFSHQPRPPPLADIQANNFKTEAKVAILVIKISSEVITAALATITGNEKTLHAHKVVFKVFTLFNYISLLSGICLFLLTQVMRPDIPSLVTIVRFTMWISLVALTCALGSTTCLIYTFKEVGGGYSPCKIDFFRNDSRLLSLFS